jgi:multiple sugar transport system permease protein
MKRHTLLFVLPALATVLFFLVVPVISSIYLSFFSNAGAFVGLENYRAVLLDTRIINLRDFPRWPPYGALVHNLIWIMVHLPLSVAIGMVLAVLLQRVRGSGVIRSVIFLGQIVPMIVAGILVRFLFSKDAGMVSRFLGAIGIDSLAVNWVAHPTTALPALILTSVWLWVGYTLIVYVSGLAMIPESLYEAAAIDGAGTSTRFWRITVPLLRPATRVVIIMTVIWELKIFDIVYASTGGGPGGSSNVMALEMYQRAFRFFEFGEGTAIATILTLLTMFPIVLMVRGSMRSA